MNNTKSEKLSAIKSFKKEDEIHELLMELLPNMGFEDVILTHERGNSPENGKDIVCSRFDPIEDKKDWYAFVIKKGVIAGTSSAIKDVDSQVSDCFTYEYKNIVKGIRVKISKVKVVTNQHFSSGAVSKILDNNSFDKANIDFWDSEKIIGFIEKHYPKYWVRGSKAYKDYIERFEARISLDDFVKNLNIKDAKLSNLIDNTIKVRLNEKIKNDDGTFTKKSRSCESIIDLDTSTIVIGEPGSGKSSLFKKLSKEVILQNSLRNLSDFYPILINFRDLKNHDFDVEKAIIGYFKEKWNHDLHIDGKKIVENGTFCLFIDALDELAKIEYKEAALKSVKSFQEKYPLIKIVCSSRPSEFLVENEEKLGVKIFEIQDLNQSQVKEFVSAFFGENLIKSKRLLKSLQDTGILDRLPKTPLTLALITIIFDEKEIEIPATIADLYRYFVDLLLNKTIVNSTLDVIEVGLRQRLLGYIASFMHDKNVYALSKNVIVEEIRKYSNERGHNFDSEQFLEDLIHHSGLIFENEKQEVQFKHLSFQEYFTAYEYFHHKQSDYGKLVSNFNNLWWQNVTLFYAGMSKDAPHLITRIIEDATPTNTFEIINNIGGLGRLTQALYNTPLKNRQEAIGYAAQSTLSAINEFITSDDKLFDFWKGFSKYNIYQILSGWFQYNFNSITLVEPMKAYFKTKLAEKREDMSEKELFEWELSLFLGAGMLAFPLSSQYEEYKKLVEVRKSSDLSLFALIEMHFRLIYNSLSREEQLQGDVNKIYKKLKDLMGKYGDISEIVNKQLKDIHVPKVN